MKINSFDILFDGKCNTLTPAVIKSKIADFPNKYKEAMDFAIRNSKKLDSGGEVFLKCAARILINFLMTRSGPFKGLKIGENGRVSSDRILRECWSTIKADLLEIRGSIPEGGNSRNRYLLQLSEEKREELIGKVWRMTKELQNFTKGETTHGLVGASKILFAVLPEIVLPVDTKQWLHVFNTFDIREVINRMVSEVKEWEDKMGEHLDELDPRKKLTTIPSVYNVMAMASRPKS